MTTSRSELGRRGESLVAEWYESQGYEILDRNWRRRRGEIDIIARRGAVVVICEVKTRSSKYFGSPALAVGHDKQMRLRRLAAEWLMENPHRATVRFDVAEVIIESQQRSPTVQIIEAAF